jgi:hypothetical protein
MQAICLWLSNKKPVAKLIFETIASDASNTNREKAKHLLADKRLW